MFDVIFISSCMLYVWLYVFIFTSLLLFNQSEWDETRDRHCGHVWCLSTRLWREVKVTAWLGSVYRYFGKLVLVPFRYFSIDIYRNIDIFDNTNMLYVQVILMNAWMIWLIDTLLAPLSVLFNPSLCANLLLTDTWRFYNPGKLEYTWSNKNKSLQSRIDLFLISNSALQHVKGNYP